VKDLEDPERTSLASWPFTDKCSPPLYDQLDLYFNARLKNEALRPRKRSGHYPRGELVSVSVALFPSTARIEKGSRRNRTSEKRDEPSDGKSYREKTVFGSLEGKNGHREPALRRVLGKGSRIQGSALLSTINYRLRLGV